MSMVTEPGDEAAIGQCMDDEDITIEREPAEVRPVVATTRRRMSTRRAVSALVRP